MAMVARREGMRERKGRMAKVTRREGMRKREENGQGSKERGNEMSNATNGFSARNAYS